MVCKCKGELDIWMQGLLTNKGDKRPRIHCLDEGWVCISIADDGNVKPKGTKEVGMTEIWMRVWWMKWVLGEAVDC